MYFYGIYIDDARYRASFNLARLLLQPDRVRRAHITLRGPYAEKPRKSTRWMKKTVGIVRLGAPGSFFTGRQNTVFLHVEGIDRGMVRKPHYPDAVLHLSVYDGDDRGLAAAILHEMRKFPWGIYVQCSPIEEIGKKYDPCDGVSWWTLPDERKSAVIREMEQEYMKLTGNRMDYVALAEMKIENKVDLFSRACDNIHGLTRSQQHAAGVSRQNRNAFDNDSRYIHS